MNHRQSARWSRQLTAMVFQQGILLGYFKTRNISLQGAYLEKGPAALPLNGTLDVIFMAAAGCLPKCAVKALVVHKENEGTGIMFASNDQEILHNLRQVLFTVAPGNQSSSRTLKLK